jgi:hypothetical protein
MLAGAHQPTGKDIFAEIGLASLTCLPTLLDPDVPGYRGRRLHHFGDILARHRTRIKLAERDVRDNVGLAHLPSRPTLRTCRPSGVSPRCSHRSQTACCRSCSRWMMGQRLAPGMENRGEASTGVFRMIRFTIAPPLTSLPRQSSIQVARNPWKGMERATTPLLNLQSGR